MQEIENKESSPERTCSDTIKKGTNSLPTMILLTANDVLKTYSKEEQDSYDQYQQFLQLKTDNPTFGYKKLAKLIDASISKTRWWTQKGGKVTSLDVIEKLSSTGLLPLTTDNPKLPAILRLLAASFTDGGIDIRMNTFHFNSAIKANIEAWKKDFFEVFPFAKESLSYIETGKYKSSIGTRTCDRAIIRFFAALGCPIGNKTTTNYQLPVWLFELSKEHKLAFIDGFFSCEVAMPQYRFGSKEGSHFKNFSLSMSKIEEKEAEHLEFLKSFCKLCECIGIKHTSINRVPQKTEIDGKPRRKDGKVCDSYRILFSNSYENVLLTHKLIPLTYAIEKKKRFDKEVENYKNRKKTIFGFQTPTS